MSTPRTLSTTRRQLFTGSAGAAALAVLSACGGNDDQDSRSSSAGAGSSSAATIAHKYGTTKLPKNPQRIITLGYTDQEPVLSLGVKPVGVVDFFGERPYGKWPWEAPLWGGTRPQIVGERDDYKTEKIAALKPDLIIGMYSGMTKANYDTLSSIAPTVAQPRGYADFTAPWSVIAEQVGVSLGKADEAKKRVAAVKKQFTDARKAHPKWKGRTVAVVEPTKADSWAVFGAGDPKLQFMTELGFVVAPSVRKFEPGGDVPQLSVERLDVIDADQLILLIDEGDQTRAQVEANHLFAKLKVAQDKHAAFLPFGGNPPVGAALAFNSVLSIPYGIRHVVPALSD